jgi:hypothetical protein
VIQVLILCVDVREDGCVLRVEPAANAGIVLRFGQEEGGVVGASHQPPPGSDGLLLHEPPHHGTVRTHVRAVAGLRHYRPLCVPTLEVEALLLFRWGVPEVGGLIRGAIVLTGLAGQDDLFLIRHQRAVGVNKGGILYQSYGKLVTYYQILVMFALVVKLFPLTLDVPFCGYLCPPLCFYQDNSGSVDLQWVPTGHHITIFFV